MPASLESVARAEGLDPARLTGATPSLYNAALDHRAAVVVRCADTADVRAAVRTARAAGLELSVFSGGNDLSGRSVRDGGLVVDVSGLDTVEIDRERRTVRFGGGVQSEALARACEAAGRTPVTGTTGLVHMVGLTLGGGYGPLNGRFGMACDNLVSAELVTADGQVLRVDADHEPDLLWALRGGGGNFGVVTAAEVRLYEVGPVYSGMIVFPGSRATSVLTGLDALLSSCPDELSLQTLAGTGPDGQPFVGIMPTWSGPIDDGPAAVGPVERLGDPVDVRMGPSPWHAVLRGASEPLPPGRGLHLRTRSVPRFSAGVVDRLVDAVASVPSPLCALSVHPLHGAATRAPDGGAAFAERRPHQMIEIIGMWEPGDRAADACVRWADGVHASLAADALPGGYVNLLGDDDRDQIRDAYGPHTDRLLAIKAKVDPDGVFRATPLPVPR